ncbi:hypothetical protein HYT56_05740 [Candidatus Woesearchaeota archaeon]|nr:hypothetical protein [Candidatus Woesearchaeota archaeon]
MTERKKYPYGEEFLPEEEKEIIRLKEFETDEEGRRLLWKEVVERFNTTFSGERTLGALMTKYSHITRKKPEKVKSYRLQIRRDRKKGKVAGNEYEVIDRGTLDEQEYVKVENERESAFAKDYHLLLKRREKEINDYLVVQANRINEFERAKKFDEYGHLSLRELMELSIPDSEMKSLINIISEGRKIIIPDLKTIELFAAPGFGKTRDELALLFPLYIAEIKNGDRTKLRPELGLGLRAKLYTATCGSFMTNGYTPSKIRPSREQFGELLRVNLSGPYADLNEISGIISNDLRKECPLEVKVKPSVPLFDY